MNKPFQTLNDLNDLNQNSFLKIILLLGIFLYFPIITFNFVWDDFELYENFIDKGFVELATNKLDTIYSIHYYPLFHLSHQIDFFLSNLIFINQIDKTHFTLAIIPHLTNLIIYLSSCYFFYLVSKHFFDDKFLQFASTLIFTVHPIHVNSISWISGRTDLLATFFCILSILWFCKLIKNQNYKNLFLVCLFYFCAIFSKVVSLTLIGVFFIILLFFYIKDNLNFKDVKLNLYFFIFSVLSIFLYFNLYFKFTHITDTKSILFFDSKSFLDLIFDVIGIVSFYFGKLFFPFKHNIVASDLPKNLNLVFGLLIFFSVLYFSILKIFKKKDYFPILCFICIIFTLTTAVYSYVRGTAEGEQFVISTVAERFAFLPSVFASLLLAYMLNEIKGNFKSYLTFIIVIIFSILIILRIPSHKDQVSYAEYTHPNDRLIYHYLVFLQSYDAVKDYSKLKKIMNEAISKYPNTSKFYIKYALIEEQNGNEKKAAKLKATARELHKNDDHFNYYAGLMFFKEKNFDAAKSYLLTSIKNAKGIESQIKSLLLLSKIEYEQKQLENAEKLLDAIIKVNPNHAEALFNLGKIYIQRGQKEKAIEFIEKAVKIYPDLIEQLEVKD